MNRIIIDGNAIYEIDEKCMQKKEKEKKEKEENVKKKDNKKKR